MCKMQRMNRELELEKRKLRVKLLGAQDRIKELSNMKEASIVASCSLTHLIFVSQDKIGTEIEEEMSILRPTNEAHSEEVERRQRHRLNMVEELSVPALA